MAGRLAPRSLAVRTGSPPWAGHRYRCAVDVGCAAELYNRGWTLNGAELSVKWTSVRQQIRRDGVTMRRSGPPDHPAPTLRIVELRDQGLTWAEGAEQVGDDRSGAWSRYQLERRLDRRIRDDGSTEDTRSG
jgi:hypothetical protein